MIVCVCGGVENQTYANGGMVRVGGTIQQIAGKINFRVGGSNMEMEGWLELKEQSSNLRKVRGQG